MKDVEPDTAGSNEPARPLTGRGLDNLVAFTRLFGYVRYFHPSDQAAAADWEKLALAGVQTAEKAGSPEELARALEGFFRPLAPTVCVFPTAKKRPALPAELKPPAGAAEAETTNWEHLGVYKSQRISYRQPDLSSLPKPGEPLMADLGGGVSALVPLALYKDGGGTLPHTAPEDRPPAPAKPGGFRPSGNDRASRLADVVLAWNVFQHFYPYFDVVQADWPAELRRALTSAATDADEQAFLLTLRRLMAALHDGHGNVFQGSQEARGVLPLFWDVVEGELTVTQVGVGAGAGELRPGDAVLAIDGRPAREALAAEEALASSATEGWRRWRALNRLSVGKRGESVRLDARHPGGAAFTVTVTRSLPTYGEGSLREARPEKIAEVKPGIFYVDMDRVSDADFKGALDRLAAAKGVVFDLRGYPANLSTIVIAHLTDRAVTSARWTVPVVTRPDRQGWEWEVSNWSVQPVEPRLEGKVAFIVDGRAISYAETYMGIIEAYRLAEIVGAPTAGTNGNINPFTLPGGYRVVWTGMRVLKHDGSQHHGIGIRPTVPVSRTLKGVAAGRDELLEKAIEVVSR